MKKTVWQLLSVGHHVPPGAWHLHPHHHAIPEMIIINRGQERIRIESATVVAALGEIVLFQPGTVHEEWSKREDPLESYFLTFNGPAATRIWPLKTTDRQGRIRMLAGWLFAERDTAGPVAEMTRTTFFNALIHEFIRLIHQPENPLITATRAFVRQHIREPLTLDALAHEAGMSKYHFIRRYRHGCGRTPVADVRALRLEYARDLILTSDLPMKAIAAQSGLGDDIALYRHFRRLHIRPGQLRRAVRPL